MSCSGSSPTGPKIVDAGKAAAVEGVETMATEQGSIHTHHGDTFALDVVRERYPRPGTENPGSPEFTELLELYKDRVYNANIASAAITTARQRFGGALRRNDRDRDGGGNNRDNFQNARPGARRQHHHPPSQSTSPMTLRTARPSASAAPRTPTYFITDAEAKARDELMRGGIEAPYDTDDWGAKILDLLTTSLTASTYSKYGERGIIGAGSLQPYLSAINTFLRHTGRDDAPVTGPTIGDMKCALQIRHELKTSEELRC
eukprot:jgi/Tetstr1/422907/TSEL_013689.t1